MKKRQILGALVFLGISGSLCAADKSYSAVDSQRCKFMKGKKEPFILALRKGEAVQSAIEKCARDAKLQGATLSGLGALQPVTLQYFDHVTKKYHDKTFNDFMEVTNLTGNITWVNGDIKNHIHITLSDHDFRSQAGHLKDATVGAVLEIQVTPLPYKINKHKDNDTGLEIITTP